MIRIFMFFAVIVSLSSFGQKNSTVSVIDFVKVKNDHVSEALFFYENNWKVYREIALKNSYIVSYQLLKTTADSTADFDLMLITEYADSLQYRLSEERFQKIIKEIRPNGPKLKNDLKPNDFRENVFAKQTRTIFSSNQY